ncbi:dockerin type I domain-containing protein [Ruminococcus albus]|uniref:Cohesin domain-containing protein n=1 Tax=Ruminococcus albus TaxID=1264 RepID=A0A1I1IWZ7_RUMAL|nr:dockerin type I domain-containing protein [Ruminococcus albus]SFC40776.1 Cohesin domain-containing protein [Ruminococcus albus]
MRTTRTRLFSFAAAFVMLLTLAAFFPCCAVKSGAEALENHFDKQDDQEVIYDKSKWIQPREWNSPKIDPKNYEGYTMLYFDKIGVYETAAGKTQRVYCSISNAEDPVSQMKFHVFYDTRLKVKNNSQGYPMNPGKAVADFSTGSAMIKEGQLVFYAYSPTDVKLGRGSVFTIDFEIPEDCEAGDLYPIGISYVDDGIAYDTFMNSAQDDLGKLHMTYLFTRAITNGYLRILGEPRIKKADLTLKTPRDGVKCTTDPKEWFGNIPSGVNVTDLMWIESESMALGTEGDVFEEGKTYTLQFKLTPAYGRNFSKKFQASVNGINLPYNGDDITMGGTFYFDIKAEARIRGDLNNDGFVNITDLTRLAAHIKGRKLLPDPTLADFNGDGKVNIIDLTKLAAHIKGKRLLIDPEYTDIIDIPD